MCEMFINSSIDNCKNEIPHHKQRGILIDDSNPTPQPALRKGSGGGAAGNFTQALSSAEVRLAFAKLSGEARQDEGGLNHNSFFIFSEYLSHCITNFANTGIYLYSLKNIRH